MNPKIGAEAITPIANLHGKIAPVRKSRKFVNDIISSEVVEIKEAEIGA